jgi:hypothetical protein
MSKISTISLLVLVFGGTSTVYAGGHGPGGILPQIKGGVLAPESSLQTVLRDNADVLTNYYGDEVSGAQAKATRKALLSALHNYVPNDSLTQNVDDFVMPSKRVSNPPTAEEKTAWYGNHLILNDKQKRMAYFIPKNGRGALKSSLTNQLWFASYVNNHLIIVEEGQDGAPSLSVDGRSVKSIANPDPDNEIKKSKTEASMGLFTIRSNSVDVDPIEIKFGFDNKGGGIVQINGQVPPFQAAGDPLANFITSLRSSFYEK